MPKIVRQFGRALWVIVPLALVALFFALPKKQAAATTYSDPYWTQTSSTPGCICDGCSRCGHEGPPGRSPEGVRWLDGTLAVDLITFDTPGRLGRHVFTLTWDSSISGLTEFGRGVLPSWMHTLEIGTNDTPVNWRRPDGLMVTFTGSGGTWTTSDCNVHWSLTKNGSGCFELINLQGDKIRFDGNGMMDATIDRNGNLNDFTFNSSRQWTGLTDDLGHAWEIHRNSDNLVDWVEDYADRRFSFEYDASANLISILTPATPDQSSGIEIVPAYDVSSRLTGIQDGRGNTVNAYTWVSSTRQIDKVTINSIDVDYAYTSGRTDRTDQLGNIHRWHYSGSNITQHDMWFGSPSPSAHFITQWRYSGNDLVTIVTPRGSRTDLTLNGSDEVTARRRRTTDTSTNASSDIVESWVWTSHFITQHTDPLGNVTDYERDSAGNVTEITFPSVTNPASQAATKLFEYNAQGQVTESTDEEGKVTTYAYYTSGADSGLLQTVTIDPTDLALATTYGYDTWHNIDSVTDPRGNASTRTYDALRRLIGTESPASLSYNVEMHYDGNGNLTSRAVENRDYGNNSVTANPWITTTFTYTVLDKVATMVEELTASTTRTTSYDYDNAGNRVRVTKPEGNKDKYVYDERQLLWKVVSGETSAVESTVENTYDDNGNLVGVKDGRGYDTTKTYDLFDRLTRVTNELGHYTEYELDKNGNVTKIQKKNSSDTELQRRTQYFDERNRRWKTSDLFKFGSTTNSDAVVTTERFKTGQVKKVTDARGNETTTGIDAAGRVTTVEDGMGNLTTYTLDENGNAISWVIAEMDATALVPHEYQATYDVLNRRLTYIELDRLNSNNSITKTYAYDSRGNLGYEGVVNTWDVRYTYDAAGRRTKKEVGTGPVPALPFATTIATTWGFDKNNRLNSHKDDANNESTWTYDALDRPTAMTYPNSSGIAYEYDLNGNVIETTDAAGNVIEDTYDELNRRTARAVTLASGFIDTTEEAFTYDALDRPTAAEDDDYKVEYEYAVIGLASYPWKETQSYVGGTAYAKTVTKTFDANGNVATEAYPSSLSLVRSYNEIDRLSSVTDGTNTIASFTYIGRRHKTTTFQSGATRTDTYTGYRDEVASIVHATSGSTELLRLEYGYNALHDRTYERYGGSSAAGDAFVYDPARRLTTAYMGSVNVTAADSSQYVNRIVYNMDDDGNRTSVVTTPWGQSATTVTYADNNLNQYTTVGGVNQTYDGNGNLTNNGTYKFKYNYKNLICQVRLANDTLVADYKYDALDRRVEKDVDGGITERYVYSDVETVSTYDGANTWKQNFAFAQGIDEVLMLEQADALDYDSDSNTSEVTRSFYHRNALGSVMDITAMDQSVEVSYRFDPYGVPSITRNSQSQSTDPLGQHWAFTGRVEDEETGQYYYRSRSYASGEGRFFQRDPLGYSPDSNAYRYCHGNPVSHTDPFGLEPPRRSGKGVGDATRWAPDCLPGEDCRDVGLGYVEPGFWVPPSVRGGQPTQSPARIVRCTCWCEIECRVLSVDWTVLFTGWPTYKGNYDLGECDCLDGRKCDEKCKDKAARLIAGTILMKMVAKVMNQSEVSVTLHDQWRNTSTTVTQGVDSAFDCKGTGFCRRGFW